MSFRRSIIPLAVLLLSALYSTAQDNTYVYKDSALLYEDSVVAAPMEMAPSEDTSEQDEQDEYVTDTTLTSNQLAVDYDSVRVLKNSKPFAYAKNLDSLLNEYQNAMVKEKPESTDSISWLEVVLLSSFTFYFFWMLAVAFIILILYKLFFTKGFFQRSYARSKVNAVTEETEKVFTTADYGKLAAQAAAEGNFRIAVRYLYLQSLQKLTSKDILQFAADKTNYQYVTELTGKPYKQAFAAITLHYEYVWYGAFEIDEHLFNTIHNKFKQFNSEV